MVINISQSLFICFCLEGNPSNQEVRLEELLWCSNGKESALQMQGITGSIPGQEVRGHRPQGMLKKLKKKKKKIYIYIYIWNRLEKMVDTCCLPGICNNLGSFLCFPGGSDGKESAYNAEGQSLIPGSGRFPGEENGYPLQYSCLENSVDRGAWWARVDGVTENQMQLSD